MIRSQYFLLFTAAIISIILLYYIPKYFNKVSIDYNLFVLQNFKNEINYMSEHNWSSKFSDFVQKFNFYLESIGYTNYTKTHKIPGYILGYLNTSMNFTHRTIVDSVNLCGKNFKVVLYPIKIWHCFCLELKTENGNYSEFFCI